MTFNQIEEILDEKGVNYKIKPEENYGLVEFWTDTAGQDIPVEFNFDGTPKDFIEQFAFYAENYDVDAEVELFAGMRGQRGVPATVRELLDDCQEAKRTLIGIAKALKGKPAEDEDADATLLYRLLKAHAGHRVEIAEYGDGVNFALEDMDTDEVIFDTDLYDLKAVE